MNPILFVQGPSDIEGQTWRTVENRETGKVKGTAFWPGVLPIQPFVMGDSALRAKSTFFLMGIHEILQVPRNGLLNFFNLVGDADASKKTLETIREMESKLRPRRCFNRTYDVYKTSRGRLPETLSEIPGCRVPRVKASDPRSFSELQAACEEFDAWPLIVRARGYHQGRYMTLLADKAQLETVKESPWIYNGVFLMEFVDFRNADMLYQKTRVVLVDGVPYPRHSIISDRWSIHAESRSDLMDRDMELCRREERFLADLCHACTNEYGGVFSAIHERIGLDIFGVDFTVLDGRLVIFEANACMNFLSQDYGKDGRYRYLESYVKDLKRAVKRMLMQA